MNITAIKSTKNTRGPTENSGAEKMSALDRASMTSLLIKQTNALYAGLPSAIAANVLNALLLTFILRDQISISILFPWLCSITMVNLIRLNSGNTYKRNRPTSITAAKTQLHRFYFWLVVSAAHWGLASFILFAEYSQVHQVFLAFVLGGLAAGAITTLSHRLVAINAYLSITMFPLVVHHFIHGDEIQLSMGTLLLLFTFIMFVSARRMNHQLDQTEFLRIENKDIIDQSERRYQTLLQSATDVYILHDEDGRLLDVNQEACDTLGYTREELLQLKVADIEVGVGKDFLGDHWSKLASDGRIRFEGMHKRKDGSVFPVDVSLSRITMNGQNLLLAFIRDITQQKANEEALRQNAQRMSLHVMRTPLAVIEWDRNFQVTKWNPAAETIFGYSADEAIGKNATELIVTEEWKPHIKLSWKQILEQKESDSSTNENLTKSGKLILCKWYNTPLIDETGRVIGVASLAQDITEQVQAEVALYEAKEEAVTANRAKSEFLSRMSHELRTPLNAILGFGQLLTMDEQDEQKRENLTEILKAGEHLLTLINEVLDLARIDAGKIGIKLEQESLYPIVVESINLISRPAQERKITITNEITNEHDYRIHVDRVRFKQVLINLLSNAVKYNREGGNIDLSCYEEDGLLRINVTDTGEGLTLIQQEVLFNPFDRLKSHHHIEGAGIGLSITRQLLELMGGTIGVDSEPGKGSTFWVKIRLADANTN
ncbi:MAG: PAS domain S-box protein [Gammaproteobacteria bacterium]|nr:PAS domain S-box protein [Gammaproteobacteria bacterium]